MTENPFERNYDAPKLVDGDSGQESSSPSGSSLDSSEEEDSGEPSSGRVGPSFIVVEGSGDPAGERRVTYRGMVERTFLTPPRREEEKRKTGYSLRGSVLERLDKFVSYLRQRDGPSPTKGEVIEAALDLFLRDWEVEGDQSFAIRWLRDRFEQ